MSFTHEHEEIYKTTKQYVEKEINPHVEAWEREGIFPAHQVFKKMGSLGLLGSFGGWNSLKSPSSSLEL